MHIIIIWVALMSLQAGWKVKHWIKIEELDLSSDPILLNYWQGLISSKSD